jgi:hypothetical protein
MTVVSGPRRLRLARPATAWLLGGMLLALAIAAVRCPGWPTRA